MAALLILSSLVSVTLLAEAGAYSCNNSADCEMLGSCIAGQCSCFSGFTGPSCGTINVTTTATCESCFPVWPQEPARAARAASAWGFSAVQDPADGLWHAFIAVACNGSGVIGDGGGDSWIAHAVSSEGPDKGFKLVAMVTPQTTFGPHLAVSPNGTFVLVFRVNVLVNTTLCGGDGTAPLPPDTVDSSYIPPWKLHSGDPEAGTSIWIAWAPRMTGPWEVVQTNITGAGAQHKSNPSIAFLRDGRVLMGYRYNPPGGELLAFAFAENNDFRGPYVNVFNLTSGKPGDEDPFVWQQAGDGSLHAIYHNKGFGYHAFATDEGGSGGREWAVSPSGAHAFNLSVAFDNGTVALLLRRERPELSFDPTQGGAPVTLFNGVLAADETAFVLAQAVGTLQ